MALPTVIRKKAARIGNFLVLACFAMFVVTAIYFADEDEIDKGFTDSLKIAVVTAMTSIGKAPSAAVASTVTSNDSPATKSSSPMTNGASPMVQVARTLAFVPPRPLTSAPKFVMLPFVEAHWQGLELIPLTVTLARTLGIAPDVRGVIADDVTPPADAAGFIGGDVVTSIGQVPTPDLNAFIEAADRVRERKRVELGVVRKGQAFTLILWPLKDRMGTANGETAPMIPPGAQSPHGYQGRCTGCHRIGTNGSLPADQGDLLAKTAPVIRANATRPHRDRGNCISCHKILP